jgi:hypothetical protein
MTVDSSETATTLSIGRRSDPNEYETIHESITLPVGRELVLKQSASVYENFQLAFYGCT